MASSVRDITSEAAYQALLFSLAPGALLTIFFHTPWAAPCKQMRTFFDALASQYPQSNKTAFIAVDAEELLDLSEAFDVAAVPFIVLVRDGRTLESISGSNSGRVRDAVEKEAGPGGSGGGGGAASSGTNLPEKLSVAPRLDQGLADGTTAAGQTQGKGETKDLSGYAAGQNEVHDATKADPEELNKRLAELVKAAPVMLFMKGAPSAPQCGFSRQIVAILRERGVRYGFFNILADEEVRQGMKTFADWPTFPQLWVGGELVGGLDIVKEELETNPDFFAEYSVGIANGGPAAPEQQKAPQTTVA